MDFRISEEFGDFGTLLIVPSADDDFAVVGDGRHVEIRLPLFNYQAQQLIAILQPIADKEPIK